MNRLVQLLVEFAVLPTLTGITISLLFYGLLGGDPQNFLQTVIVLAIIFAIIFKIIEYSFSEIIGGYVVSRMFPYFAEMVTNVVHAPTRPKKPYTGKYKKYRFKL